MNSWRILEINGGAYQKSDNSFALYLNKVEKGYSNAQIDDYGGRKRSDYLWGVGTRLSLEASFTYGSAGLQGTAGFGFWNAPFGDPTIAWPTLPKAAWFFFGSKPNDLPLAAEGAGRGWFGSTIDGTTVQAILMGPLAPIAMIGNQFPAIRRRIWPLIQRRLGISFYPISARMDQWHKYELLWEEEQVTFFIDGKLLGRTDLVPQGKMGFVCWIDNQYMIVQNRGKMGGGVLEIEQPQSLKVKNLHISQK